MSNCPWFYDPQFLNWTHEWVIANGFYDPQFINWARMGVVKSKGRKNTCRKSKGRKIQGSLFWLLCKCKSENPRSKELKLPFLFVFAVQVQVWSLKTVFKFWNACRNATFRFGCTNIYMVFQIIAFVFAWCSKFLNLFLRDVPNFCIWFFMVLSLVIWFYR